MLAVDLEQLHAVGVFAEDFVRHVDRNAGLGRIGVLGFAEQRVAPTGQHFPVIAFGHVDVIVGGDADGLELEAIGHGRGAVEQARAEHGGTRPKGQCATQETATRNRALNHGVKAVFLGARIAHFVKFVPGQVAAVVLLHG